MWTSLQRGDVIILCRQGHVEDDYDLVISGNAFAY
ncbi:hypothetical protein J2809_002896 [Arthrobacter pascens]|nr:hypothetical protein [Arthrobacter pascens]